MLVERAAYDRAVEIAREIACHPRRPRRTKRARHIGPVVSEAQYDQIQGLIQKGIAEGARLVAGGPGRPDGLNRG